MPGIGANSKLGFIVETTPGTPREPTSTVAFTEESFSSETPEVPSDSIGGTGMRQQGTDGDPEAQGSISSEFDCENSGKFLYAVTGPEGYTAPGSAWTDGQITAQPSGSASSTGASLAAGDYIYFVCPVWTHDIHGENFIAPKSPASAAVTVTSGQEVALSWTNPTTLTLANHTYKGTNIYRSETDGAASTATFIAHVDGTGASFTDDGKTADGESNEFADTSVAPVPNTAMYKHLMEGATAAEGEDRLETYTVQTSKNVGSDERTWGCKLNQATINVPARGDKVTLATDWLGANGGSVAGEWAASTPASRRPVTGKNVRAVINGSVDCTIKSITCVINNQCERDANLCAAEIAEGLRTVGGQMTLQFRNRTLYNLAKSGDLVILKIFIFGEALATGSTLSAGTHGIDAIPFPRQTVIDCQSVKLTGFSAPINTQGQIEASCTWSAYEDSVAGTDSTITLINTISVYNGT